MSDKIFNARRPPTNVIFAAMEIVGLLMVFFGPPGKPVFMTVAPDDGDLSSNT